MCEDGAAAAGMLVVLVEMDRRSKLVGFRFAPDVEAFRHEVRVFLEQEMAAQKVVSHGDDRDLTGLDEEFERALLRRAGARGFLGVSLPAEWGGGGRPAAFGAAFNLEV